MKNLATLNYWTNIFLNKSIKLNEDDVIRLWVLKYLKFDKNKTCIEVGCYPGKYLTIPGNFGVEVNGIDFIEDVVKLPAVFTENGYNTGLFICEDFTKNTLTRKFNYVMSFGFIEHFDKWENIIEKHCELVSNDGYLIIEAPNFKGFFQMVPRFIFDYSDLKRHNLDSMNLNKWVSILEANGFEIVTAEYFGNYGLWFDRSITNKSVLYFRKALVFFLKYLKNIIHSKEENHKSFSSYMGVIARKKNG